MAEERSLDASPRPSLEAALEGVGLSLLALLVVWWAVSVYVFYLVGGVYTWIPVWDFLGLDFAHTFLGSRYWLAGGNPYTGDIGDPRGNFSYPPIVLPLFAWTVLVPPTVAYSIWITAIAACGALAVSFGAKIRQGLGGTNLPSIFVMALVLWSTPFLFSMERGNCDALVLLAIVTACWIQQSQKGWLGDLALGCAVALAGWVKLYPLALLPALLFLGAWRAALIGSLLAALLGWVQWDGLQTMFGHTHVERFGVLGGTLEWFRTGVMPAPKTRMGTTAFTFGHSLTTFWKPFFDMAGLPWVGKLPGLVGSSLVLFPPSLWVSWRVFRSAARSQLMYPYILWVLTVVTFWPPMTYDYNLIFLPLLLGVTLSRRDHWLVWGAVAAFALWAQPFAIGPLNTPFTVFALKVAGLVAATAALLRLARGGTPAPQSLVQEIGAVGSPHAA